MLYEINEIYGLYFHFVDARGGYFLGSFPLNSALEIRVYNRTLAAV
jgi:hypothetical protein